MAGFLQFRIITGAQAFIRLNGCNLALSNEGLFRNGSMNHLAKNAQTATILRNQTDVFLPITRGFSQKLTAKNEANPRDF